MNRQICIHGHFYQPPRENPWLEEIEPQDSAYPYQNWNERITAECYAPNTASRILNADNKIIEIVNNYAKISFNFGPTLLSWLEKHSPETYQAILAADKESMKHFSGHGAALAQCYNHMIMPLANSRDKRTQIVWGIRDFEHRFGRKPEGMWLPETAVDVETLELLAEYAIAFTVLAPHQVKRVRKIGGKTWKDVSDGTIDPTMPYACNLPSGRTITLFFYDGPIAHDISFGGLLKSGENFAQRMTGIFSSNTKNPQLAHIATDGETYGHHHRFGDMALTYCLHDIESKKLATITIYGEHIEKFPPSYEVEIIERSSWSCAHGVERWRDNCGCSAGGQAGWSQHWRKPLRNACDWLRDRLIEVFEREMSAYVKDPWQVRDEYISVILDRSPDNVERFLTVHAKEPLSKDDTSKVLKLLEMQRHAMLMYTSCGWFFADISGIETVQIMQYAARALQLAREVSAEDLEPHFCGMLEAAPSNIDDHPNGRYVYERCVTPAIVDFARVGAHYAISSLFDEHQEASRVYCYTVERLAYNSHASGNQGLVIGRAQLTSNITYNKTVVSFAVAYLGDHTLSCRISSRMDEKFFENAYQEIRDAFLGGVMSGVVPLMTKHFGDYNYSLQHLFKREQDKTLNLILDATLQDIEALYRQIYELHYPLMQLERSLRATLPKVLTTTAAFILNRDLQRLIEQEPCNSTLLQEKVGEVKRWSYDVDKPKLSFVVSRKINGMMEQFSQKTDDGVLLQQCAALVRVLAPLNLDLNLWKAQNIHFAISKNLYPAFNERAAHGDHRAQEWIKNFRSLEECLHIKSI